MKRRSGLRALALAFVLVASTAAAEEEPLRVATLLPFVEDALRQTEGGRYTLVASVRRSLHTPVAEGVIDLGNPHSPSFERLAEARPDLVVGDRGLHGRLARELEASGARLLLLDTSSTEGSLAGLVEIGAAVHAKAEMEAAVAVVRERLADVAVVGSRRVLALFGTPGRFYAVTDRTWLGGLLANVGYENVAPDGREGVPGYVVVNDEALMLLRPDLVLVVAHGEPARIRAEIDRRAGEGGVWASLRQAPLGLHVLDPERFGAPPGLALADAAVELARYATPPAEVEAP